MASFGFALLLKTFEVVFRFLCHVLTMEYDSAVFYLDLSLTLSKLVFFPTTSGFYLDIIGNSQLSGVDFCQHSEYSK
jgi:hypothetical protein